MAASGWLWTGASSNDPNTSSNWMLVSGSGNATGIPQAGDTATINPAGLIAGNASVLAASTLNNDGNIESLGGPGGLAITLEIAGNVNGSGALTLAPGSIMQLDGTVASTETITFAFATAEAESLILSAPAAIFATSITNLNLGDRIEFGSGVSSITNVQISGFTVSVTTNLGTLQLSNVSFAAGVNRAFYWYVDQLTGLWTIQVAPPNVTWTGAVNTDLGTAGN